MLTRKHSIEGKRPFGDSVDLFSAFDASAVARLAMVAGDITLIVDPAGRILDGTADPQDFPQIASWIGRDWLDTVTVESRPKVMEMLAAARKQHTQHWRQVNHQSPDGDIPVKYVILPVAESDRHVVLGRDLRSASSLQQRLLQAQQSLERDYMRLRQLDKRYRMLFELSSEPVMIVDGDGYRIREANPAAHRALGVKPGVLAGNKLLGLFAKDAREPMIACLGAALTNGSVSPIEVRLAGQDETIQLTATGYRQRGAQFLMVRMGSDTPLDPGGPSAALDVIEAMPDAFVLADAAMTVVAANPAFVELVDAASLDQIRGKPLAEYVGRPGIDLELIEAQLDKHGFARNVGTVIGARDGVDGEPVELSAVRTGGEEPHFGFVIRQIGRRLRDLPPSAQELPRSVEQLTELVGRMSLKDIVRESTDLIERLCIEAALAYTSDNRASAAEILGLSRQSLYSKAVVVSLACSRGAMSWAVAQPRRPCVPASLHGCLLVPPLSTGGLHPSISAAVPRLSQATSGRLDRGRRHAYIRACEY
ncbi:transcriptional regulator PpsR [Leptolyngbya sp. 15MV]|nr:transcriptional regulator PpsR [Leptolyngbya sp. 15MV]